MRGASLTSACGLFPFGIAEIGVRCIEADLFAWVKTDRKFDERFISLPAHRDEAEAALALKLDEDHRFSPENAAAVSKRLFADAFAAAAKESDDVGDTLCPEEP